MDGNEFLQQLDQETEVAQSEQINNGGDANVEEIRCFTHRPTDP